MDDGTYHACHGYVSIINTHACTMTILKHIIRADLGGIERRDK